MNSFQLVSINNNEIKFCYNNKHNIICTKHDDFHLNFKFYFEYFDFDVYREFVPLRENQYKLSKKCEFRTDFIFDNPKNEITGFKFILIDPKNGHYVESKKYFSDIIIENITINNHEFLQIRELIINNKSLFSSTGIDINDEEIFNILKSTPKNILGKICCHFAEFDTRYYRQCLIDSTVHDYKIKYLDEEIKINIKDSLNSNN